MRVITGTARGKRLATLDGNDVRPTTDRVKEAIFSMVQFEVNESVFLDLYCGSGQLGIEALSRGAKSATFVDNHKASHAITRQNLQTTNLVPNAILLQQDATTFAKTTTQSFDIILLDPPYNSETTPQLLQDISLKANDDGVIIAETAKGELMPEQLQNNFRLDKTKVYGQIKLSVYRQWED